jgi:prevent-host-death family protein
MRQVNARDFGNDLDHYLEQVKDEPILIARAGKPLAVVVSFQAFQQSEREAVREYFKGAAPPSVVLSDELIRERREEAKREDSDE